MQLYVHVPIPTTEAWRDDAACHSMPRSWWFPDKDSYAQARPICMSCPVREKCLAFALENQILHGMWGGTTERERRRMLRSQRTKGRVTI